MWYDQSLQKGCVQVPPSEYHSLINGNMRLIAPTVDTMNYFQDPLCTAKIGHHVMSQLFLRKEVILTMSQTSGIKAPRSQVSHKSQTAFQFLEFFYRSFFSFCFVGLWGFGNTVPVHSLVSRLSQTPSNMGGISQPSTEQSSLSGLSTLSRFRHPVNRFIRINRLPYSM